MSDWTVDTLKEHVDALRAADQRALQIKEEGDAKALDLARQIQTYKDQQHNGLLDQLRAERGTYATKSDLSAAVEKVEVTLKALTEFVSAYGGRQAGIGVSTGVVVGLVSGLAAVMTIVVIAANLLTGS